MTDAAGIAALQDAFWCQTEQLLLQHTNPWELDEALCDWGYTLGPCEAQDLLGLDHVLERRHDNPTPILPRMVAEGRLGKKGGVGFYRYPGGGGAVIDPLIEDLILEEAWFGKVIRRPLSAEELVAALNAALASAGLALIQQGVVKGDVTELAARAVHFPAGRDLMAL